MSFLDIISAQPSLQIHLATLRDGSLVDGRALSSSFFSRNKTRLISSWNPLSLPVKLHSDAGSFEIRRGRIIVKAVVTVQTKSLVHGHNEHKVNKNSHMEIGSGPTSEPANKDSTELDEKERLRRMRISKANKGKMPWNTGRKHSAETLRRIRERTKLAMQDPKVRMKLVKLGHAQTDETKEKIGAGVKRTWLRRRDRLAMQEACHFEWQNLIAEASRAGYVGEEELQWDSYEVLGQQLHKEWLESLEKMKTLSSKGYRRAPKSPEQRRKIAEAIAAKWDNPEYRGRVISGMSRYRSTTKKPERKPRKKPSSNTTTQSPRPRQNRPKKASEIQFSFVRETKAQTVKPKKHRPQYKDPLARTKLEMIKNIRAQRAAVESTQVKAIAQARLSIAEAEKASKALELAAETSSIAREALLETRKLLAEAIQSIEALETGQIATEINGEEPLDASIELDSHFEENKDELVNHAEDRDINRALMHALSYRKKHGYGKISVQDIILNDEEEFVSNPTSRKRNNLPQLNMEDLLKQLGATPMEQPNQLEPNGNIMFEKGPSPNGAFNQTIEEEKSPPISVAKTKKWVRGRLVEISEEEEEDEEGNQDISDEEEEEDEGLSEEVEDWSQWEEEDQSHNEKEGLSEEVEDWSQFQEENTSRWKEAEDQSHDEKEGLSEEVEDISQWKEAEDRSHDEKEGLSEEVEDWSQSEVEDTSHDEKEGLSEEVEDTNQWKLAEDRSHDEKEGLSEHWSRSEAEDTSHDEKEGLSEEVEDTSQWKLAEDRSHDEKEGLYEDWSQSEVEDTSHAEKEGLYEDWSQSEVEDTSHTEKEGLYEDWSQSEVEDTSDAEKEGLSEEVEDTSQSEEDPCHDEKGLSEEVEDTDQSKEAESSESRWRLNS